MIDKCQDHIDLGRDQGSHRRVPHLRRTQAARQSAVGPLPLCLACDFSKTQLLIFSVLFFARFLSLLSALTRRRGDAFKLEIKGNRSIDT